MYIPYQQIAKQFHLKSDDVLLIASDITKLAYTAYANGEKFDVGLFVDSFKACLVNGTLLIPAFNDSLNTSDSFNIKETPPSTGTLSSVVFKQADFIRTRDPLHSFMVSGKQAVELSAINSISTFGPDSIFAFLHHSKAKMLFIDVDLQHSFTFAHYVEEMKKVNYRQYKQLEINFIDEQNKSTKKLVSVYSKKRGVKNTLNELNQKFIEKGAMEVSTINGSECMLLKLDEAYTIIEDKINVNGGTNLYHFSWSDFFKSFLKQFFR